MHMVRHVVATENAGSNTQYSQYGTVPQYWCASSQSQICITDVELELIQTQMTQKPMLRAEVYARALRASQNRKEDSLSPLTF